MIGFFDRYSLPMWLLLLLPAAQVAAQQEFAPESPARYGERPKNGDRAGAAYQADRARYKDVAGVLVLPGLVARRKENRVEILAEATGLESKTVVEFLLIDQHSGRGYESLLWSFAKPSHVHRALVFIGMKPGKPFNPARLRFWSKGERVLATIAAGDSQQDSPPVRLESLVVDKHTGKPLPGAGFVFAGSFVAEKPGQPGDKPQRVYAADVYDPRSVASIYNDPIAVLDVPRRARKSAVYGTQLVGPEYDFAKSELVTIVLEPEYKDGRQRVKDLVLRIRRSPAGIPPGGDAADAAKKSPAMEFVLTDETGKTITEKPELPAALGVFAELIEKGYDPYVSVRFDGALPLAVVRKVCRVLSLIDSECGIRVEPPLPGQLYYQALLPDKDLLDRKNRIIDPWELRLVRSKDGLLGTLTLHESVWADGPQPKQRVSTFDVDTARSLREQLDADAKRREESGRRPAPPVLLVFADADLAYGRLMQLLTPASTTHNVVHVFLGAKSR